MLINWQNISEYINTDITGILHIGGHLAEELDLYQKIDVVNVIWIEANEERAEQIKNIVPSDHIVVCAVVGDESGKIVKFNEANNGQSSSIFELGTHAVEHPEVHYISSSEAEMQRIDDLADIYDFNDFNFVNLDIQGAELLALKGMGDLLDSVDFIYCEVNKNSLYDGCALIDEIDNYLIDFERVITEWTPFGWGDAFYVRKWC
jgi:FkbM family methyltransferase